MTSNKEIRKTAKRLIKQAKKHPDWYTEQDVSYAKMIKRVNKKTIDNDKSDIVKGSVEGVIIADKIAEEITTILQLEIIFSVEIIPRDPRINCKTGN